VGTALIDDYLYFLPDSLDRTIAHGYPPPRIVRPQPISHSAIASVSKLQHELDYGLMIE